MPVWLMKLLPYGLAALALLGAVLYIDHKGYQRSQTEAKARELQQQVQRDQMAILFQKYTQQSQDAMTQRMLDFDGRLLTSLSHNSEVSRTVIQPTLVKEIQRETRFSDPAAGISDGMRGALNTARSLSERPCAAASNAVTCVTVPAASPTP